MIGVAFCTAALVIVLSVFNGLGELLRSLYGTFNPDLKVEAAVGKTFVLGPGVLEKINDLEGIKVVTEVIEDYCYLRYRDADMVATLKGVSENFLEQERLDNYLVEGTLKLREGASNYAIIGRGIQYALGITPGNDLYGLQVHYIKNVKSGSIDVNKLLSKRSIIPNGVFAIEKNYDENYVFVPLEFAQTLLNFGNRRTALEIKTEPGMLQNVKTSVQSLLGNDFKVLDNDEQHADLYKLLKLEKLFVFLALSLILVVGSINIFFSLSMLAIDKKKDISILYAMGAGDKLIKSIFVAEGCIISLSGALIGLIIGGIVCWLQENYGLVSMGMETSVMENYPINVKITDFIYTAITVIIITLGISYRPAVLATRYQSVENL